MRRHALPGSARLAAGAGRYRSWGPFTVSHAAAALPLLRTPLPPSALVIGTTAPDLPYYLPGSPGLPTHSAVGVVTVDLLLGAAAWLLWHGVLVAPALAAAPGSLRRRLDVTAGLGRRLRSWRQVLLVALALVTGAATHVLWDEFTHADRWGVWQVPLLARDVSALPGYRWAQYASGVVGALVLLAWVTRWWRRAGESAEPTTPAPWWPALLVGGSGLVAAALAAAGADAPRDAAFLAATTGGGVAVAVCLLLAAGWHVRRR